MNCPAHGNWTLSRMTIRRCYMASHLSALGALASALVLAACAATGGNVKPAAQTVAGSQPCVPQTGSRIAT